MPSYDFKNKETGEIIELKMSMAELDKYKDCLLYTSDAADE